jgi:excisionase family DNA binding protein
VHRYTRAANLPDWLRVEETAAWLGIGRDMAYSLVRTGELPAVSLGRRIIIPRSRLLAWMEGQAK